MAGTLAAALLVTTLGVATAPSAAAVDGGARTLTSTTTRGAADLAAAPAPISRVVPPKPKRTRLTAGQSRTEIDVKFREGSSVRLRAGKLTVVDSEGTRRSVSAAGHADPKELAAVERVVSAPGRAIRRLFAVPEADVDAVVRSAHEKSRREQADLNLWHRITLPAGSDIEVVVDALNGMDIVEVASAAPLPAPLPVSPDYRSRQGYHSPATASGIDANYAWTVAGGSGQNVRIHDIEYSWNGTHEDLTKLRTAYYPNGTLKDPWQDTNHGTAVAGAISGDSNAVGVTGLVPDARLQVTNANNVERGYDLATSILVAANALAAGDVMLIEQQLPGPGGACGPKDQIGCIAVEWSRPIYDAVVNATSRGIIVVEAAGNGSQNLDASMYGTTFPNGLADSGAIVVGAGGSGAGGSCQAARTRMSFSNYGRRVDLQGWGECVTTTGYGSLYNGGINAMYTGSFGGTSSASPIVAGAAAALSSVAKSRGITLTPRDVRARLKATGTAQAFGAAGNIGPLPNLRAAIAGLGSTTDTTPPTMGSITYSAAAGRQVGTTVPVSVTWSATDASGVAAYAVYIRTNGGTWASQTMPTPTTRTMVWALTPGNRYDIAVAAQDTQGNWSGYVYTPNFGVGVFQENSPYIGYSAGWTRTSWASASGGYLDLSGTASASASFTFTGTNVAWVGTKGTNRGVAYVYLDGALSQTVDLYSATTSARAVLGSYSWAALGTHTITIVVAGTSGRPKVDVDAITVLG